jgi:hypothetical protein
MHTHGGAADLLVGFCGGWVLASEYTAGLVVAGIMIWLAAANWKRAAWFALAMIPPLMLIPAYSWICLGNPFTLPYSHQASFPAMQEGLYAIKWPDLDTAYRLLFGPTRGLFFWTPFLALACVGYYTLCGRSPSLFWLTYLVPVIQVMVISGRVWDWTAGPTLGPRYLAPMLPLLALPAALGLRNIPWVGVPLAAASILLTGTATLINATPSGGIHNPLLEFYPDKILAGQFGYTWLSFLLPSFWINGAVFCAAILAGTFFLLRRIRPENAAATANQP